MKKLLSFALLFSSFLFCLITSCGQSPQNGRVIFKTPAGWKSIEQGSGATVLVPADVTEDNKLLILVLPSQQIKASLRQDFETILNEALASNERLVQQEAIKSEKSAEGYDLLTKNLVVEDKNSRNRTVRIYTAVGNGKQIGIFTIVLNNPEAAKKYQPGVDEFYASYDLPGRKPVASQETPDTIKNAGNQADDESSPGGGATALYVANILTLRPKTFGGIGYDYVNFNEFWLFLPNGTIYFGIPAGSPADFDFSAACGAKPEKCGTYRTIGGRYEFEWRGQKVSFLKNAGAVPLGRTHSGQSGNTVFRKIDAGNNLKLDGVFARRSFTDLSSGTTGGNVSGETRIAFSSDGRFAIRGFTGFTTQSGSTGATGSTGSEVGGTYTIRSNILFLRFENGREARLFFFRFPGEEEKVISINGVNYIK